MQPLSYISRAQCLNDQWLSISSPDLGSKVLQEVLLLFVQLWGHPSLYLVQNWDSLRSIKQCLSFLSGFQKPGWHTAGAHCRFE